MAEAAFLLHYGVLPAATFSDQTFYNFMYSGQPEYYESSHLTWGKGISHTAVQATWEIQTMEDLPPPEHSEWWNIFPLQPVSIYMDLEQSLRLLFEQGVMMDTKDLLGFTVTLDEPLVHWVRKLIVWAPDSKSSRDIMLSGISALQLMAKGLAFQSETGENDFPGTAAMEMLFQTDQYFTHTTGITIHDQAEMDVMFERAVRNAVQDFIESQDDLTMKDLLGYNEWEQIAGTRHNMEILLTNFHKNLEGFLQLTLFRHAIESAMSTYIKEAWDGDTDLENYRSVQAGQYGIGKTDGVTIEGTIYPWYNVWNGEQLFTTSAFSMSTKRYLCRMGETTLSCLAATTII